MQNTTYPAVKLPQIGPGVYDIRDFGAVEGGIVSNTQAIRQAVEAAHQAGGGRVLVPAGLWLTGPIELLSHVELHVERGALLQFHKDLEEYPLVVTDYEGEARIKATSPIHALRATDIAITGEGVIDGNGHLWRPVKREKLTEGQWNELVASGGVVGEGFRGGEVWYPSEGARDAHVNFRNRVTPDDPDWREKAETGKEFYRPVMVNLEWCDRILIEDITIQNSPAWNVHPTFCENLTIRNAFIRNDWFSQNGDGLDLDSCRYVLIENSRFDVGDDGICMKCGKNAPARKTIFPTEYVTITGCTVFHGHGGFVVGSEMSRGVRHIKVDNCLFLGTDTGIRFKSAPGRGGVVEDIEISNIRMVRIEGEAIIFTMGYHSFAPKQDWTMEDIPEFKDIYVHDVVCEGAETALYVLGLEELPIHDITLENVRVSAKKGYSVRLAENIRLKNVTLQYEKDPTESVYFEDTVLADGDNKAFGGEVWTGYAAKNGG
ncbi:MAG: glycoside hydrolase family 28 protein [Firmicutes bacterium]|nr:glycoside hydrolase family 28 protein [Bacillota bacterium]